ncbi:MAG: sterol desaturase family protein [Pseudohongiella sp.]|nr:sterol desaturase family protein [Pseudohongiella sp.]
MELISRYLILIMVCFSIAAYTLTLNTGNDPEVTILLVSVVCFLIALRLERSLPYRKAWNRAQQDIGVDLTSAGILVAIVEPLLKVLLPLIVAVFYASQRGGLLDGVLPLWLEIIFVLATVEFGKYWSHRLHHSYGPFWWLHAMHHSSERMYTLNGLRFHPLNYSLNFVIAMTPVMVLGVSPEAIFAYLAITQPVVLIQHANINLKHGWLNWVFSTPEVHRWHHSTQPSEANRNFGNALLIWDHVFGTFKAPEGFTDEKEVGLFNSSRSSYPAKKCYFSQLLSMFRAPCCRA